MSNANVTIPVATPPAASTGVPTWVWIIGGIVAAGVGYELLSKGTSAKGGPGYYVLLYNYPRGNRDRRLKGFNGPFKTKREAEYNAGTEDHVWYPTVRHLKDSPFNLGM